MKHIFLTILILSLPITSCFAANVYPVRKSSTSNGVKKEVKKGNVLYNKGEFEEALKQYEQALLDSPDSDIVNYDLGAALYKTEDYQAAVEHFEKSLVTEDEPLEQKGSYNIGNAKYKYGIGFEDTEMLKAIDLLKQSLHHYEHALTLDPEDEDAKYNYEFVKRELERLQKKLEQQQQEQKQKREQEKGEDKEEKEQQKSQQQQEQEEEQQEQEEQKQDQQPDKAKEEKEKAESQSPQQQREQDEPFSQTPQADSPEEMSEQQARMLLEGYSQEEEPKGLYKEKIPTRGLPEIMKDW